MYALYDALQEVMFSGSLEEIIEELVRVEAEELHWNDDRNIVQDAINLLKGGDAFAEAAALLETVFFELTREGEHTHEYCMSIEIPAIHQDAILFWKCDDGQFRSAWPDNPAMNEKAMRAIQEWKSSECFICHRVEHKLSCPNNPNAPVKIPVEIYPLEDLI